MSPATERYLRWFAKQKWAWPNNELGAKVGEAMAEIDRLRGLLPAGAAATVQLPPEIIPNPQIFVPEPFKTPPSAEPAEQLISFQRTE
jgi:hypothetical protein